MIRKECDTCLSWDVRSNRCLRVAHGMACVVGELPPGAWVKIPQTLDWERQLTKMPPPVISPPPPQNPFLAWSHENLAKFAKEVHEDNKRLREKLAKIQGVIVGA